ncbi:MAG TPA: hypothetical protein VMS56_00415 [Thermoanaerobaculia bacterium]|nr:hypothetical protein [Thermoanaerobaculia bacterium]
MSVRSFLAPLALTLSLVLFSCVTADVPRQTLADHETHKTILVGVRDGAVVVSPYRVWLEYPDQEAVWHSVDPAATLEIEFADGSRPRPCPAPVNQCRKRFEPGPGVFKYSVTVRIHGKRFEVDPELIILY